jgi:low temperature requirement protein LtrA
MKGIELPPRTEDFTADPVELFFDLAYVLAFSQLVALLIANPTWAEVGKVTLLFLLLWLPWQQLTWAANAVSGNGRGVRLILLTATVASIPMASATSFAFGDGGPVFAVSLAVIMLLGFAIQALPGGHDDENRRTIWRWITPNLVAIALLVGGSFLPERARLVVWLAVVAVVIGAMVAAGRGTWLVRTGHMAERHGLILIIALGEVIVAIGLPVLTLLRAGEGLPAATVLALATSGVFACLLWWGYFDRPAPGLEHHGEGLRGGRERGRWVRNVYTWAHAPIVCGVIFAAAGLEEIALHPTDSVPTSFRLLLFGGLAMFALGITASIWTTFRVLPRERMVSAVALALLLALGGGLPGVVLLLGVVVVMGATLVAEHVRIER